jgi:deoxycytidine triphosphate deaminase
MLLSDRDIKAQIEARRLMLDPYEPSLLQPSSIDVRLDRYFRVFNNQQYTHIDPALQQDDLTTLVEPKGDDPFVLHPGEFVLGSTLEVVTLPDDLAGRLEGKALALDTPIPTPAGWRTMADLRPGDEVFDEAGLPTAVVAASEVMLGRPCRDVVFSDGQVVTADIGHLWSTRSKSARKHGGPAKIRTTAEIGRSLRLDKEWNHHVRLADAVHYPTRNLPIDPYVLGAWLGDGTSTAATITCSDDDREVLDEIARRGYPVHRVAGRMHHRIGATGHSRSPRTGRYERNASLSSMLRNCGLLGNKHVPAEYLTADIRQRTALLQGLMDTDGHVDDFGRCEFVNTRECLADAVVGLAASLGLRPVKRKKRAMLRGVDCGPAYQVKFTPDIPVFRLKRKLARQKAGRFHTFRAVIGVRPTESRPVKCIKVEAPSGLFLVGPTYIPTHNSSLGRLGLLTHSTAGFIDPGFTGHITLELSNVATLPIILHPGMKIGQLCLFRLSSPSEQPYGSAVYGSRYQGQRGPTPSRSWVGFRRWPTG